MKPLRYCDRRKWQDEQRAQGKAPECGRMDCKAPASPAWVNLHTPLLYCSRCAKLINRYNPGICSPEGESNA